MHRPLSRSVRRRYALRGLPVPEAPRPIQIELRDATGIFQSFLIMPGMAHLVTLSGYRTGFGRIERIEVPITVHARVV